MGTKKKSNAYLKKAMRLSKRDKNLEFRGLNSNNNNCSQENPGPSRARNAMFSHDFPSVSVCEAAESQQTSQATESPQDNFNPAPGSHRKQSGQDQDRSGSPRAQDVWIPSQSCAGYTQESPLFNFNISDLPLDRNLVTDIAKNLSESFWKTTPSLKELVDSIAKDDRSYNSMFHTMDVNILLSAVINENLEIYVSRTCPCHLPNLTIISSMVKFCCHRETFAFV